MPAAAPGQVLHYRNRAVISLLLLISLPDYAAEGTGIYGLT